MNRRRYECQSKWPMGRLLWPGIAAATLLLGGCEDSSEAPSFPGAGGATASGGTTASGGAMASGGATASGGAMASGGATASGGAMASGGATGGVRPTGGTPATGGVRPTGGTPATGGVPPTGGTPATGGVRPTGGTPATGGTSGTGLVWRRANLTNFESYPDPNSEECIAYNGCTWAGQFAGVDGKMPESWVQSHNIVAVHSKDFSTYELKTLRLRQGGRELDVVVYDLCSDNDCSGCCTANSRETGFLIDIEKYTMQRFGSGDGIVEWACLDC